MQSKMRADEALLAQSLVETRSKAQALILAGDVDIQDRKGRWILVEKAGQSVVGDAVFRIRDRHASDVGRGAKKLRHAIHTWGLPVKDIEALDIGASTGGFTQVLLEYGAAWVVAMDVGTHQLHERLRRDPRVYSMEQQHVLRMDSSMWAQHKISPHFDAIVTDLSFISLRQVIAHAVSWLKAGGWWVMLVKPQFELEPRKVPGGIVREAKYRDEARQSVRASIDQIATLEYVAEIESPIQGADGNTEYLFWVRKRTTSIAGSFSR